MIRYYIDTFLDLVRTGYALCHFERSRECAQVLYLQNKIKHLLIWNEFKFVEPTNEINLC